MIIGISGKIGSGKDTIGKIIQYLVFQSTLGKADIHNYLEHYESYSSNFYDWQIKKYAGKLKQIVSLMLNIPVVDLEKQSVKDQVLGEAWDKWYVEKFGLVKAFEPHDWEVQNKRKHFNTELEIKAWWENLRSNGAHGLGNPYLGKVRYVVEKTTVREFLQKLGTDAIRNNIHENAWVNALFADYKKESMGFHIDKLKRWKQPNWLITDVRFPNEAKAVTDQSGITIRVERWFDIITSVEALDLFKQGKREIYAIDHKDDSEFLIQDESEFDQDWVFGVHRDTTGTHPSETALDNYQFNYTIQNNGTLDELVEKVKQILLELKVI